MTPRTVRCEQPLVPARGLIKQGGVSLDDVKIMDVNYSFIAEEGSEQVLKVGKRKFALLKSDYNDRSQNSLI